jgi:putative transposase
MADACSSRPATPGAGWNGLRWAASRATVYLDGIVVHVRGDGGRVSRHTMDVTIGVNLLNKKELLGPWLSEAEGRSSGCRA